jgi:hypothetical protein
MRGLVLVFVLSLLSLAGVLLTVTALGGLGEWTRWQFIGLFGVLEAAAGGAAIVLPNVWRLPVSETQTKRAVRTHLAASVLLIPHWGALARVAAGAVLVAAAVVAEGVGPATAGLLPFIALAGTLILAASMLVARAGVARPDIDVVQVVIVRPKAKHELPPVSIGASLVQFLLSIATIPIVKALSPAILYRPEMGPSWETMAVTALLVIASAVAVALAWQGRIDWRAPAPQQREAERYA